MLANRRLASWLPLLGILAIVAVIAAACGGDGPTATAEPTAAPTARAEPTAVPTAAPEPTAAPTATAEPTAEPTGPQGQKYGGTLRVAGPPTHTTFDPHIVCCTMDWEVSFAVYNALVRRMHDGSYKPDLAVSWEANDDVTQWTFKLRQGVKFHNGKDFTAEDVVFNFKRLIDPEVGSPILGQLDFIEDIVALDDYTVRFDLSRPNAFFLEPLTVVQANIIPKGIDLESLTNKPVGTGPFMLTEYVEGEYATMARNPNYWDKDAQGRQLPYLDALQFVFMNEDAIRLAALRAGDVDIEYFPGASAIDQVKDDPAIAVQLVASGSYLTVAMDVTVEPFNNKLVRQAMRYAVDRDAVNQVAFFGYGTIANDHPIPPTDPSYNAALEIPPYDPQKARELLEEAGYPDGIDIELHTAERQGMVDFAVAVKESAEAAGIRVNVIRDSEDIYWTDIWLKVPLMTVSWSGRAPLNAITVVYQSDAAWNESHYENAELDRLLKEAPAEFDEAKRNAMFARMQEILVDDAPRVIAGFQPVFFFTRDYVRGVEAHPFAYFYLHEAWLDK